MDRLYKKIFHADNIYEAFDSLVLVSKLSMMMPYSLVKCKDQTYITLFHIPSLAIYALNITLYMYCFFYVMMVTNETFTGLVYSSLLFKISDKLRATVGFIFVILMCIDTFLRKEFNGKILTVHSKVDNLLKLLGVSKNYTKIRTQIILQSAGYFFINMTYTILSLLLVSSWSTKLTFSMTSVMYGPGYLITIILLNFTTNVNLMRTDLKLLNKQMLSIGNSTEGTSAIKSITVLGTNYSKVVENTKSKLHVITKVYDTICRAADVVNSYTTMTILIIMGTSFVSVVFNLFYVFITIAWLVKGNPNSKLVVFLFFSLHQCILHSTNIILATYACDSCENEFFRVLCLLFYFVIVSQYVLMKRYSILNITKMNSLRRFFCTEDVVEAINPMLWFTKITALAPYTLKLRDKKFKSSFHVPFLFLTIVSFAFTLRCYLDTLITGDVLTKVVHRSPIMMALEKVRTSVELITLSILLVNVFLKKNLYSNVLNVLTRIDRLFASIGVRKQYAMIKFRAYAMIILNIFLCSNYIYMMLYRSSMWKHRPSLFSILFTAIPISVMTCMTTIYTLIIKVIRYNFECLNTQFEAIAKKKQPNKNKIVAILKSDNIDVYKLRMRVLTNIYDAASQCVDILNEQFSSNVLSIVHLSFVSIVFNLFNTITTIFSIVKKGTSVELTTSLVFSMRHGILHIINMAIVIIHSNECTNEAKKTAIITNKILIEEENEEIIIKLHQFSTYLLHRVPKFSACGFFPVDNTLFFTMIGAATTYLIILIQFTLSATFEEHLVNTINNTLSDGK